MSEFRDYTIDQQGWGHAATQIGEQWPDGTRRYCLFGPKPRSGDVVLLSSQLKREDGTNGVLQYRIVGDVETPADPGDQHFVTLSFMDAETNAAHGQDPRR